MKGNKFQLVSQLMRGSWLIDPGYAAEMLPLVAKFISGEPVSFYDDDENQDEISAGFFMAQDPSGRLVKMENVSESDIPPGSIAVFQQRGAVMKETFCGIPGTADMRSQFLEAMASPKISGAVVVADSPGGAVNGTFELNQTIFESEKPVIGFVDGLAASAAYLILSGCSEIHASSSSAMIGSIGVLITLRDYTERLKELGIKEITITANTSPEKNLAVIEALAGEPGKLQAELDAVHALFKDAVKRTRSEISDDALRGSVYLADEALKMDLIDSIQSFERTVERALELGDIMQKNPKIYV